MFRAGGIMKPTILCVDDDPVSLKILSAILKSEDFNIITANCGEEARSILEEHSKIHLLITDIQMPNMSGFELLSALKISQPNLPTIVITKFDSSENIRKAWRLGTFDLLGKPINRNKILQSVDLALSFGKIWTNPGKNIRLLSKVSFEKSPPYNSDELLKNLAHDEELLKGVLEEFLIVSDGLIEDAFRNFDPNSNYSNLKFYIHKLKGVSESIGGIKVSEVCDQIYSSITNLEIITRSDLVVLVEALNELQGSIKKHLGLLSTQNHLTA